MTVAREGRDIVVRTEFALLRDRISPAEYPAFRQWVERGDTILRQRISLQGGAQ